MKKFKVAIMGTMPAKGYSGGRYCAWIMAEALANEGNHIYMLINSIPEFCKDFEQYPHHKDIQIILVNEFYGFDFEERQLDYVICVPTLSLGNQYYLACMDFAVRKKARFAFINFETPNWYQQYAEMGRSERSYKILKKLCRYGCLIFSLAYESQKYAIEYYKDFPNQTEFCVWSPPINSMVADSVREEKRNQILIFLRIVDKHKGGEDFLQILGEYLRGVTFVCIVGNGEIPQDFLYQAQEKAQQYGIRLQFEKGLTDYRKFQEIKKSKLVLFCSYFEGYGYPPVEALYCGTRCIVYDLPVLREISGDSLSYCEPGNISMMREKIQILLKEAEMMPVCVDTAEFIKQASCLQFILESNYENPKLICKRNLGYKIQGAFRRYYYVRIKSGVPEIIKSCIDCNAVISQSLVDREEKWKFIKKEMQRKKIYIWGCGIAYQELYPKYKNKIEIQGILDSSTTKIGTKDFLSGRIIQNPEILQKEDKESIVVLISNKTNVDTIIEELKRMGVRYYHSLCMIELNSTESKIYKFFVKRFGKNRS